MDSETRDAFERLERNLRGEIQTQVAGLEQSLREEIEARVGGAERNLREEIQTVQTQVGEVRSHVDARLVETRDALETRIVESEERTRRHFDVVAERSEATSGCSPRGSRPSPMARCGGTPRQMAGLIASSTASSGSSHASRTSKDLARPAAADDRQSATVSPSPGPMTFDAEPTHTTLASWEIWDHTASVRDGGVLSQHGWPVA